MREQTIHAAYEWRALDIRHAGSLLGICKGVPEDLQKKRDIALSSLRIMIDTLHREEKSFGLI